MPDSPDGRENSFSFPSVAKPNAHTSPTFQSPNNKYDKAGASRNPPAFTPKVGSSDHNRATTPAPASGAPRADRSNNMQNSARAGAPERANPPKPPGSGSNSKSGSDADPGLDAGKDLRTRAAAGTSRPSKSTSSRLHHLVEMRDNTTVVFRAIGKNIVDRSYLGFGTSDPKLMRTLFGKDVVDSDVVIRCLNEDGTLRDTKARMDKSGVLQMTEAKHYIKFQEGDVFEMKHVGRVKIKVKAAGVETYVELPCASLKITKRASAPAKPTVHIQQTSAAATAPKPSPTGTAHDPEVPAATPKTGTNSGNALLKPTPASPPANQATKTPQPHLPAERIGTAQPPSVPQSAREKAVNGEEGTSGSRPGQQKKRTAVNAGIGIDISSNGQGDGRNNKAGNPEQRDPIRQRTAPSSVPPAIPTPAATAAAAAPASPSTAGQQFNCIPPQLAVVNEVLGRRNVTETVQLAFHSMFWRLKDKPSSDIEASIIERTIILADRYYDDAMLQKLTEDMTREFR